MIDVDDQIAGREIGQFGEEGVSAFALLLAAHEAVAQHVLLGKHFDIASGEAVIEGEDGERDGALGGFAQRLLPALDQHHALDAMIEQETAQPLARADRVARDDALLALALRLFEMLGDGFVDIAALRALGREIAGAVDTEIENIGALRLVEGGRDVDRQRRNFGAPLLGGEIELIGRQRAIAARRGAGRLDTIGMIVTDRLEACFRRTSDTAVAQPERALGEMLGERDEALLEQRQPMLHAGEAATVADRLIEWIARRGSAEHLTIAAAEALDALFVQQRLGRG